MLRQKSIDFSALSRPIPLRAFLGVIGLIIAVMPIFARAETDPFMVHPATPTTSVTGASTVTLADFSFPTISVLKTRKVWVTAYSSDPDETDSTPFTTASGSHVRVGIVATNLFPFGTKIIIPALFGNNTFVVQDRMHSRKKNNVDIWMPSRREALRFGVSYTDIVVVESGTPFASAQN